MTCAEAFDAYILRSLGYGERLLPRTDIGLCEQIVLIGSGMIWNIYFAAIAVCLGFFLATLVAVARTSERWIIRAPANAFVYLFRGTPLFIQFFFVYELFVLFPKVELQLNLLVGDVQFDSRWLTRAWLGALFVLFLNTAAYSAEIFYGALRAVPKGDLEAADAIGLTGFRKFRRITWPTLLRLAWPSYTNEAIFLFHATTLVFFSSFPAWRQQGDALYYANYFADKTFNPFVAYPIAAAYFILATLALIGAFSLVNRRLNRHLAPSERERIRYRPQFLR